MLSDSPAQAAIRESFRHQAGICAAMEAPLTAQVLRLVADLLDASTPLGRAVLDWPGDPGPGADVLALRLAGGLHALCLSGADPALAAAYADGGDERLRAALSHSLLTRQADLLPWLDSPPQTNELRRSAALIPAAHWLSLRFGLPLVLSELGSSAGLNLIWDRYALAAGGRTLGPDDAVINLTPDWRGRPPETDAPVIAARAGVDRSPIDPERDRLRLLAYLWAGQDARIARTGIAAAEASRLGHRVTKGDAGDWLETRLADRHPGHLHLIYHSVTWQYFPAPLQARCDALLAAAGAQATPKAPLAHLSFEGDGTEPGAALRLRLWSGAGMECINLGRADFHGRWIDWQAPPACKAGAG
ncbi:DUF2332 domain-containing protein [Szabonella alba]|uniref:DUF2332 family protein n=1 Tax=Szabonella alba TaxID=2804194 RepID=A0A8K0Y210_9RHOB|nr:DUF2332 family protein [Szabonella alba]MBL4918813.1 DUF2332 family protein [Szabonella alba]